MNAVALLLGVTLLYAGYNLFIKMSGGYVPVTATSTVLATICLQLAALFTSAVFYGVLVARGGQIFALSTNAYLWAAIAGVCIGGAEIGYLYLFGGVGAAQPMAANTAIPVIVSGTIVIALAFSFFVLAESISWHQIVGSLLIIFGIFMFFARGNAFT